MRGTRFVLEDLRPLREKSMMTDRARLRALLEKATPRPWCVVRLRMDPCPAIEAKVDSESVTLASVYGSGGDPQALTKVPKADNAALIVAAVNALPELLDEVERRDGRWACPECGCIGHERLERERDEEKEKREESDRDIAEIEGLRQAAESESARLRAQRDGLRVALLAKGYHAPQNGGRCQHGMEAWVGSHCEYDCAALAAVDKEGA